MKPRIGAAAGNFGGSIIGTWLYNREAMKTSDTTVLKSIFAKCWFICGNGFKLFYWLSVYFIKQIRPTKIFLM
jgi:hypothetical protein